MRNIFSNFAFSLTLALTASLVITPQTSRASAEPETLLTQCASAMSANTLVNYRDEYGTVSRVTIGEIAMLNVNRYQVLVRKQAPVVHPSLLEIKISNDSPFIHDFEAPIDYLPGARVYGLDWKPVKQAFVQAILKLTVQNPVTGTTYYYSLPSGRIPVVRKTTAPKSPFDAQYAATKAAACSPWFDQAKHGSFYDMHD